ncbi:hypothetical protein CAL7716_056770 [Calothrix sp. PCC 7716]|nr:hypothetical protein CAL7716_056770 [Calothrix sp. PCC 7716]
MCALSHDFQHASFMAKVLETYKELTTVCGSSLEYESSKSNNSVAENSSQLINDDCDELTLEEERDKVLLEHKVERAFYEAGKALKELRDRRLYRASYKTFEEYAIHRFGYNRRQPYRLIEAADVVDTIIKMCPNGTQILPTNERQVRELTKLEPDIRGICWEQAVKANGGKVPSGRLVKDIVERIMEKERVPNPYSKGEVCQIIAKDNPDLKGKAGCWCLVKDVYEFSCTVIAWDGEYTLRVDHLKSLNYLDTECNAMQLLHKRISTIRSYGELEHAAIVALKQLGQIGRHYLTELEEIFLSAMERKYNSPTVYDLEELRSHQHYVNPSTNNI